MLLGNKALEASRARASAHLPPSTHKAAGSAVTIRHSRQTGDLRTLTRKLSLFFYQNNLRGVGQSGRCAGCFTTAVEGGRNNFPAECSVAAIAKPARTNFVLACHAICTPGRLETRRETRSWYNLIGEAVQSLYGKFLAQLAGP